MVNKYKNEAIVKFGEVEILLRPTFNNLSAFESSVLSMSEFSFKLMKGTLPSTTQYVQAIYYFQAEQDNAKRFNLEQINEFVMNTIGMQISKQILPFLSIVAAGYDNAVGAQESIDKVLTEEEKKS